MIVGSCEVRREGDTTMAEGRSMTAREAVNDVLASEHADVLRESVAVMVREIMELEVAQLAGAEHGERAPGRRQRAAQRVSRSALGHAGRGDRAGDPAVADGELSAVVSWSRAGARSRRWSRSSRRPMSTASRPGRSTGWSSRWGCGASPRTRSRRMCRGLDEQVQAFRNRPLEGAYPYLWLDAKIERVREPGGVRQKALVIAYAVHESRRPRGARPRRRRGRDRGVLDRVPVLAQGPRPGRRQAVRL